MSRDRHVRGAASLTVKHWEMLAIDPVTFRTLSVCPERYPYRPVMDHLPINLVAVPVVDWQAWFLKVLT